MTEITSKIKNFCIYQCLHFQSVVCNRTSKQSLLAYLISYHVNLVTSLIPIPLQAATD